VSGDLLIWQSFETKQTEPISISQLHIQIYTYMMQQTRNIF